MVIELETRGEAANALAIRLQSELLADPPCVFETRLQRAVEFGLVEAMSIAIVGAVTGAVARHILQAIEKAGENEKPTIQVTITNRTTQNLYFIPQEADRFLEQSRDNVDKEPNSEN